MRSLPRSSPVVSFVLIHRVHGETKTRYRANKALYDLQLRTISTIISPS